VVIFDEKSIGRTIAAYPTFKPSLEQVDASAVSVLRVKFVKTFAKHGGTIRSSILRVSTVEDQLCRSAVLLYHLIQFCLKDKRRMIDAEQTGGERVRKGSTKLELASRKLKLRNTNLPGM